VLTLAPRAEAAVLQIEEEVEPTLAGDGELATTAALTDWGSKYAGKVVRIAGLLHLAKHGANGVRYPVQLETIEAAERIGRYFKACAINVFTQIGASPDIADALYLLRRVVSLGTDEVSERDMFTACSRSRFPTKEAMTQALKLLVDHGYLLPLNTPKPAGGGRVSPRFRVHPLAADAADGAR
jgi:replicative DNA helicase